MSKKRGKFSLGNYPSVDSYLIKRKKDFFEEKIASHVQNATPKETEPKETEPEETDNMVNVNSKSGTCDYRKLEEKIKISEKNLKQAKKLLRETSDINLEKDLRIKKLSLGNLTTNNVSQNCTVSLFDQFSEHFKHEELKVIRSVGPGEKNDSSFILKIMRFLYNGDEAAKLKNRSAVGRKYKGESKLEVTIWKQDAMKKMLAERVNSELSGQTDRFKEASNRIQKSNELIRSAIHNILRQKEKEQTNTKGSDENNEKAAPKPNEIITSSQISEDGIGFVKPNETITSSQTNEGILNA